MSNKFDELAKGLAQSVTRRQAFKKFGVGIAGMALACFGLPSKARAATYSGHCMLQPVFVWPGTKSITSKKATGTGVCCGVDPVTGNCLCVGDATCPTGEFALSRASTTPCGGLVLKSAPCSFTS
jgi:hypothetical protein